MKDLRVQQDLFHEFYQDDVLCVACRDSLRMKRVKICLGDLDVESYCVYQGAAKDCLLQYKEFYDEALYPLFFYSLMKSIQKRYHNYTIIVMPSSHKRIQQRGFHHMMRMVSVLSLPVCDVLVNEDEAQQKYLTRTQRRLHSKNMRLTKPLDRKNYLLVDDVLTSGSTLLAAYDLVLPYANKVKALTFSYGASIPIVKGVKRWIKWK